MARSRSNGRSKKKLSGARRRSGRGARGGERRWFLAGVLILLTLAPVVVLAWRTSQATRVHRDTAQQVLRDYAMLAADQYHYRLTWAMGAKGFNAALLALFRHIEKGPDASPPRLAAILKLRGIEGGAEARTAAHAMTRSFFRFRPGAGELVLGEAGHRDDERAWLAGQLSAYHRAPPVEDGHWSLVFARQGDRPRAWIGVQTTGEGKHPPVIWGIELIFNRLRKAFDLARAEPLLPEALTRRARDRDLVAIEVRSREGEILYRSPTPLNPDVAVQRTSGPDFGAVTVTASIADEVADQLVIGGMPPSRAVEIAAALGTTLALVALAFWLLRRERELARLRSGFVANVSHELRTPLAQIRLFAETLLLGRIRSVAERRRSLEIIDQEARRLSHHVENVLQFSRAERQAVELKLEPQPLRRVILDVIEAFRPLADASDMAIELEYEDSPPVAIDADAMRRVLLNLLDNAVKYGPRGQTIRIGLFARRRSVRVIVEDEGRGVPPKMRDKIWEKYWRAPSAADDAVAGTGIGLFLVRQLVERQGGRVQVAGAPGRGARFVVDLPAARRKGAPAKARRVVAKAAAGVES